MMCCYPKEGIWRGILFRRNHSQQHSNINGSSKETESGLLKTRLAIFQKTVGTLMLIRNGDKNE